MSSRTAHRIVGYFEEEAVLRYALYLQEIDAGRSPNVPTPAIAIQYWKLPQGATLRDVVLVVKPTRRTTATSTTALPARWPGLTQTHPTPRPTPCMLMRFG